VLTLRYFSEFRLVKVTEKGKRISLYSIHHNPFSPHEFCVSGRDQYIRIYDTRRLSRDSVNLSQEEGTSSGTSSTNADSPMKKFCPHHLTESQNKTNVTAAVYNYNGQEILGSYNDENIYLFDATHSDMADCIKVYEGHRNNATGRN
jgi:WD repeat-containing protein 42A